MLQAELADLVYLDFVSFVLPMSRDLCSHTAEA